MAHSCDFAVVKISPDPLRDEAMNAMVIVLRPDRLQVCLTPNPERLRAIAPGVELNALEELKKSLQAVDNPDEPTPNRIARFRRLPGIIVSDAGSLQGETAADLDAHLHDLVARLLSSIHVPASPVLRPKVTSLTRELASVFKKEKLLGREDSDLDRHKIVRNVSVSNDGTLRADFVAKNRVMHVTETVDLRTDGGVSAGRLKDIAVAAVTLDEAKRNFGKRTKRYFVYAASTSDERQARGFLQAAEHHAEHTFNFATKSDRGHYLDLIFGALRGDLAGKARMIASESRSRGRRSAR
jgi:hypothetical protein